MSASQKMAFSTTAEPTPWVGQAEAGRAAGHALTR